MADALDYPPPSPPQEGKKEEEGERLTKLNIKTALLIILLLKREIKQNIQN